MVKEISDEINNYLKKLYYSPNKVGSFSGISQFYEAVKNDGKYECYSSGIPVIVQVKFIKQISGEFRQFISRPVQIKYE